MRRLSAALLAIIVLSLLARAATAGNTFDYCLLCHGAHANGNYGIRAPKLSGMEDWYLKRQLENFASGARGMRPEDAAGHEMAPVALRLQLEGVLAEAVRFIGTLDSGRPAATVKGDVSAGRKLYETCAACHGVRGEGNAALQSPALAARSDWYLATQLSNYKAGLRGTDERDTYGAQMRAIAAALPDEKAINDVIAYINTLK
jgi:cytochrome c oxidase subunit 2